MDNLLHHKRLANTDCKYLLSEVNSKVNISSSWSNMISLIMLNHHDGCKKKILQLESGKICKIKQYPGIEMYPMIQLHSITLNLLNIDYETNCSFYSLIQTKFFRKFPSFKWSFDHLEEIFLITMEYARNATRLSIHKIYSNTIEWSLVRFRSLLRDFSGFTCNLANFQHQKLGNRIFLSKISALLPVTDSLFTHTFMYLPMWHKEALCGKLMLNNQYTSLNLSPYNKSMRKFGNMVILSLFRRIWHLPWLCIQYAMVYPIIQKRKT